MGIKEIEVRHIRNIGDLAISPAEQFNIILGRNGSGKTSLLEAIHVLGLGRSFRTVYARKLIQEGFHDASVFGKVDAGERVVGVGVGKSVKGETTIRVDGTAVGSASLLAELMPIQLIGPDAHELIDGEPQGRRAFVDWGLFHVEHGYLERWRIFRRLLQQRNAALKQKVSAAELKQWDAGLAAVSVEVGRSRETYVKRIEPLFQESLKRLFLEEPLSIALTVRRGWPKDVELQEVLVRNHETDRRMGYTTAGAHRADIRMMVEGKEATDYLSRGQKKLAVCALRLAQVMDLLSYHHKRSIVLVDDLPAELDEAHRRVLLRELESSNCQCFITTTDPESLDISHVHSPRLFHVEHGALKDVI